MDKKVLGKIMKCLRLSASSEPHEAAAALRQAQALMRLHGVTDADLAVAAVQTERRPAGTGAQRPPQWYARLAKTVEATFGVAVLYNAAAREVEFAGIDSDAAIAAYAFCVLRRQVQSARRAYYVSLSVRLSVSSRTARADTYANAWVVAAAQELEALRPDRPAALALWLDRNGVTTQAGRQSSRPRNDRDVIAGWLDGAKARVRIGVGAEARQPAGRIVRLPN